MFYLYFSRNVIKAMKPDRMRWASWTLWVKLQGRGYRNHNADCGQRLHNACIRVCSIPCGSPHLQSQQSGSGDTYSLPIMDAPTSRPIHLCVVSKPNQSFSWAPPNINHRALMALQKQSLWSPKVVYIIFKNSVHTTKKNTHFVIRKISLLMLFKETNPVYKKKHNKPINTKCRFFSYFNALCDYLMLLLSLSSVFFSKRLKTLETLTNHIVSEDRPSVVCR
jgi:hypothetical protein